MFGGRGYTLKPEDYMVAISSNYKYVLYPELKDLNSCTLGIVNQSTAQKEKASETTWVLGNIFLTKFLSIFDWDEMKIGLGVKYKK